MAARFVPQPTEEPTEPEPEPEPPELPGPIAPQPDRAPEMLELTGALDVSDSSLVAAQDGFYLFHTGQGIATKYSEDLLHWEPGPSVFAENPAWIAEAVPNATILWAPDVNYFGGAYHLYYAASTFASSRSCIGHAVSPGLGGAFGSGEWVDQGSVFCSNTGDSDDDWNAIDPHVLIDSAGLIWLVFGSFMSGIHLVQLDETGRRQGEDMIHLASRRDDGDAIQAPILVEEAGWYYLFTSINLCCRGVDSTRSVMVGRSREAGGPYVDADEVPLLEGGGTVLVASDERWRGPGGSTVFRHEGRSYHVFHAYDAQQDGQSTLRISELFWSADQWPLSAGP